MRCPHCNEILSDDWVKRQGASIMGRSSKRKGRSTEVARANALKRWDQGEHPVMSVEERAIAQREKKREYYLRWREKKRAIGEQVSVSVEEPVRPNKKYNTEEERVAARQEKQREYNKRFRERHPERLAQLQADARKRRDYQKLCVELAAEAALLGNESTTDN